MARGTWGPVAGLLLLTLNLSSLLPLQAARLLPRIENGRKLQQNTFVCDVSNVYFVQDARCDYNTGDDNGIRSGLWTTVIKHNCPDDLTSLTVQISLAYSGGLSLILGVKDCSFVPGSNDTTAFCQLAPVSIYHGAGINTDDQVTIELGSLPLSQDSQYAIWYPSGDHLCGSTNLAPYYFTIASATFAGQAAPVATPSPPLATTPVATTAPPAATPAPTLPTGQAYRLFPDTAINLAAQIPPGTAGTSSCPGGLIFTRAPLQCFKQCVSRYGAVAASHQSGCCFCYTNATTADLGPSGGAPGVTSFILSQ